MRIIKKYSNRRLYDTEASSYVNLDELASMVRRGEAVQVVDASSGEDLTRSVLFQVILDAPGTLEVFPPELLHRIIRSGGGDPLHPLIAQQMRVGLELLETQLAAFEQQFGWPGAAAPSPPPGPPPADVAPQQSAEDASQEAPVAPPSPPRDPELDALRARLADLEARLSGEG